MGGSPQNRELSLVRSLMDGRGILAEGVCVPRIAPLIMALMFVGCAEGRPDHSVAGAGGAGGAAGAAGDTGGAMGIAGNATTGGSGGIPNAPQGGNTATPMVQVDAGDPGGSPDGGADAGGTLDSGTGGGASSDPPAEGCTSEEFEKRLYWFCTKDEDWEPARASCMAIDGDLVVIDSMEEQAFLAMHLASDDWQIGLNKINASTMNAPGTWEWVDGSTPGAFMNWDTGEPDNLDCAVIKSTGKWQDFSCSNDHPYICEVE